MRFFDVTNSGGTSFRCVELPIGGKYGLQNCLTHTGKEPMLEFYDLRYMHTPNGQFVSRYALSQVMAMPDGLLLDTGSIDWQLDSAAVQAVQAWVFALDGVHGPLTYAALPAQDMQGGWARDLNCRLSSGPQDTSGIDYLCVSHSLPMQFIQFRQYEARRNAHTIDEPTTWQRAMINCLVRKKVLALLD